MKKFIDFKSDIILMDFEKEIGGYIDNFNTKFEKIEDKNRADRVSLEELKKEFIVVADQVIKPTFEKFKIFLEKKNQNCSIKIKSEMVLENELPKIVINIHPPFKRNFGLESYLKISFHLTKSEKIGVYVEKNSLNGDITSGSEGEFNIEEITSEFAEQKIISLIKDCYLNS